MICEHLKKGNNISRRVLHCCLAVSDPLHRWYRVLPAIPVDLDTSFGNESEAIDFQPFLASSVEEEVALPRGANDNVSALPFRVMCPTRCNTTELILMVFSSSNAG